MFFEIEHPRKTEWISYIITDQSSYVMHVGICKFSLIGILPDWQGRYETDGPVYVAQIAKGEKIEDVVNVTIDYCQKQQIAPALVDRFKLNAVKPLDMKKEVLCIDTGVLFPTAAAAARAADANPASMHRHLDGVSGYPTVKGKKYIRMREYA